MNARQGERDDATLVKAALAGDTVAFTTLVGRHKEALYRFVRRYVGDADEAFDLIQETFVACWTRLEGFDTARPFPAWLRRIALNKCRDWSRRRKVRQFFFGAAPLIGTEHAPADIGSSDHGVSTERHLAALDAAIASLPAALKEPLVLTMFEQLSHQETAHILGISTKAVETRIYRAKQILRDKLTLADG